MSDLPQQPDPDLHAIFGIGESDPVPGDPIIEVERVEQPESELPGASVGGLDAGEEPPSEIDEQPSVVFENEPVVEVARTVDLDADEAEAPAHGTDAGLGGVPGGGLASGPEPGGQGDGEGEQWTGITSPSSSGAPTR